VVIFGRNFLQEIPARRISFFEAYDVGQNAVSCHPYEGRNACVVTSCCTADDLAKLSKVKAQLEIIGDYADMEKVRDVLKELANKSQ
jgi:hypothetical protein